MQGTSGTAAGGYGEVLLASLDALLLVGACYRMLETGGVRGVSGDGYVYVLLPHDGYALAHVVGAVAVYLGTGAVGVSLAEYLLQLAGEVVVLGLYVCKAVDTGDDLRSVLSKTIQDYAQRFLANLVCLGSDSDSALSGCEGLVACQEAEALGVLLQEHLSKVSMSQTYLTLVSYRTRDTESLQALSDGGGSVGSLAAALLDGDSRAGDVSPACVLKADRLNALDLVVYVQSGVLCNLLCFLERSNAIAVQNLIDFVNSSFI